MDYCIAKKIEEAAQIVDGIPTDIQAGQAKYRAYFVQCSWYVKYKSAVNARLKAANCSECIVSQ